MQQGNLSHIPIDVIFFNILSYCDYSWTISCIRLVCREWSKKQDTIKPNYFMIKYDGTENDLKHKLMDSNKLHLVTKLSATFQSYSMSFLVSDMEKQKRVDNLEQVLVSKLTSLKELIISNYCSNALVEKIMKIESLQSLELQNFENINVVEFMKYPHTGISSFTVSSPETLDVKFNDWPLEKLTILTSISELSWNSILESKFSKTLSQLHLQMFATLARDGSKLENLTHLKIDYFGSSPEELQFLKTFVKLKTLVIENEF